MSNPLKTVRIKVYNNRTHKLEWRTIRVPKPEQYDPATYSAEEYLERLNQVTGRHH